MIDLTSREIFDQIRQRLNSAVLEDDVRGALIFSRNIKFYLASKENSGLVTFPEMRDEYAKMIAIAQFICLPSLSDKDCINLVESNILDILRLESYDAVAKVKGKLLTMPDFSERDVLRRKLREALMRNTQLLGTANIKISDVETRPTVGQWLKKYGGEVGATATDIVKLNQFMAGGEISKLAESDKALLRKLVTLFEYLKLSSQTPEGLEDTLVIKFGDKLRLLRGGNFEDVKLSPQVDKVVSETFAQLGLTRQSAKEIFASVDRAQADKAYVSEIVRVYDGDPKQEAAIKKEYDALVVKFGTDTLRLRAEFTPAVQKANIPRTVAIVQLLAERGDLVNFMATDEKLAPFLAALWQKRYTQTFVDDFKKAPDQPQYVRIFLRYVLEERLGMSPSDAARVGVHLGNIFVKAGKKSYNTVAYFDVASKSFVWFE